jgi:CheY-like chemotaxis protein
MISILVVDDDIDKVAKILTAIRDKFDDFTIETAIDSVTAQRKLVLTKFDIVILDLNLPYRNGDKPDSDGGKILLGEINRNNRIKSPNYIIGLTQYLSLSNDFSKIWNVIEYDPVSNTWNDPLLDIIKHSIKAKKNNSLPSTSTETIFVEGETDKRVILDAIKFFYPYLLDKVVVKNSVGASFVARDIIIWGKSLKKNTDKKYIKAVALLDGDEAGKDSKKEIERVITEGSAESKTFKIIQLNKKFANHLIPLYAKGLKIPVTLEELFTSKYWSYAESKGWLEKRNNIDDLMEDPRAWDKFNVSLKEYVSSLNFSEDEFRYFSKFKTENKEDFCKYLVSLDPPDKEKAYCNVKILLESALESLFGIIPSVEH